MRLLLLLCILHLTIANNKKPFKYVSDRSRVVIESVNRDYFNYFNLTYIYHNRTSYHTKIQFEVMKRITLEQLMFEINIYQLRNYQYHLMPLNSKRISAKKFIEDNVIGLGTIFKKYVQFPLTPKKYVLRVVNTDTDKKTFTVPLFGDYKVCGNGFDSSMDAHLVAICWIGQYREVANTKSTKA